ncbi:MAG: acetate--CoA ligase family protein [Ignavibacteriaceae bacterium]|nr:acetate--CoA ligase family protein [Ignavibacteriaceae bacterium]
MKNIIDNFFYPKSICIAGASTKEKSIGYELLKSIKIYNYTGKIFPVNPKADEVLGYKCFHSIDEIKEEIDLAIVLVPKAFAEETIDNLLDKGVKSIILITAGFKETGTEGELVEKRILEKVKSYGARLVGPNCMGVISTFNEIKLNATFVAEKPEVGTTAFFSQSGAIGAAVLNSLRDTDIRFGHFISAGNKADISENDLLLYWQNDSQIKTITYYLESFVDGESFIKPFIDGDISKPVILLKGGRTSGGMKAASSHTGALGSNDKVVDAIANQFNIIRADSLNELFNTAKGFENFNSPSGNRIAVLTNAGGPAILAVDALEKRGLTLATLSQSTKEKLKEIVHPEGSVNNPVDLLPGGSAQQYKSVNEILLADDNVDAVVSIFVEPVMVPAFDVIEGINSIQHNKPIFQVVMPLPEFWQKYRTESDTKKPLFRNPEDPAIVISNLFSFYIGRSKRKNFIKPNVNNHLQLISGYISPTEIEKLCSLYNFPIVKNHFVSMAEMKDDDFEIDYPIVLKAVSKDVIHKSEFDAVKLNINSKKELIESAQEMADSFALKGLSLDLFMIQPFIKMKHEILIGGFRDPSFGPIIMFGTGGKYVEVFNDTAMRSAYLSDEDIEHLICETKIGRILHGVRGEKPIDIQELKRIIKASAQMMLDLPSIIEFDFNPLLVSDSGKISAVDIRIKSS